MKKNVTIQESLVITINDMILRMTKVNQKDKIAINNEFKEWIYATRKGYGKYDFIYLKPIKNNDQIAQELRNSFTLLFRKG